MGKLDGKTAIITGGARGQGRSHTLTLAREGASVVMVDNLVVDVPFQPYPGGSPDEFAQTQKMLDEIGARYLALQGDVRNPTDLEQAVSRGLDEFGSIDIAVCNAGIATGLKPTLGIEQGAWQATLDTNLTGVFNTIRAALPRMVEQRSGRIIATSSMAGRAGYRNGASYTASKWGVIGLVKSVAAEYGEYGITANCVCPTSVNSPMIHNADTYAVFVPDAENPTREQFEERARAMHPLGIPYIEPEDISQAILFLASDSARYMSGEVLTVSGGKMASNSG